jgi:hypothetical protein
VSNTYKHKAKGKDKYLFYNQYCNKYFRHPDFSIDTQEMLVKIRQLLRLDLRQQLKELNEAA